MKIKNIDEFLENSFIPNHVMYNRISSIDEEPKYEKSIPLYKVLKLKLSDDDKKYIIKYLKDKGIIVRGQCGTANFESDDYVTTRTYRGSIPTALTKEETSKKFKLYNQTHDPKVREQLIIGNMLLVVKVLRCMHIDHTLSKYDLLQAGYVGLIKAIDNYDSNKGAFSSYAVPYIEGYIKSEIPRLNGIKRSDAPVYRIMKKVENECGERVADNPLIASKVADKLINEGIKYYHDENVRRVLLMNTLSLDEVLENNENEELYSIGYEIDDNPLNSMYDNEMSNILSNEIKTLKEKKRKILELRYGLNGNNEHTLRELGEEFDMTHFGISLNIDRSLEELKRKNKVRELKVYLNKEI